MPSRVMALSNDGHVSATRTGAAKATCPRPHRTMSPARAEGPPACPPGPGPETTCRVVIPTVGPARAPGPRPDRVMRHSGRSGSPDLASPDGTRRGAWGRRGRWCVDRDSVPAPRTLTEGPPRADREGRRPGVTPLRRGSAQPVRHRNPPAGPENPAHLQAADSFGGRAVRLSGGHRPALTRLRPGGPVHRRVHLQEASHTWFPDAGPEVATRSRLPGSAQTPSTASSRPDRTAVTNFS